MGIGFFEFLLLSLLAIPLVTAGVVALLGPGRAAAVRWVTLGATLAMLALALELALAFNVVRDRPSPADSSATAATFRPQIVPGSPGIRILDDGKNGGPDTHATSWNLLPLGPGAIQFYIGLDGLNVWLVVLIAVLMVPSVLISWNSIQDRVHEFHAWLMVLATGMLGVFLAFDIILFYVFFELTLVPLFFLIGIWGGPERRRAARKFFIFTLTGSLITLLGALGIVLACYHVSEEKLLTFSIPRLVEFVNHRMALVPQDRPFWLAVQTAVFLALTAGFAIKVPLVPLHTWLPLAHVEAPTAGSVLLAGVLLKIGVYGFLRLCLPLAPDASFSLGVPLIGTLAAIGILYGALCAYSQSDIKKLVAYSSVSHLGYCMLGMFALNAEGISGSLLQMVNHGLSTGALFLLVGMLYDRYHTRKIGDYSGMAARLQLLACFMVFICLTSVGLPFLNGFVGEVLVLTGAFESQRQQGQWPIFGIVAAVGIVLGALYLLTMLQRVFFGPLREPAHDAHEPVPDLNVRELFALVPIAVLCVAIGVYPNALLNVSDRDILVVARITASAQERAKQAAAAPPASAALETQSGEEIR